MASRAYPRALLGLAAASVLASVGIVTLGGPERVAAVVASMGSTVEAHRGLALLLFASWALAANLIVLPAGSVSLVVAGTVLGWWAPALVWWSAQVATAPFMHTLGARTLEPMRAAALARRLGGAPLASLLTAARTEGFLVAAALRLLPVLPSALAGLIAGSTGIARPPFMLATVLLGWIRPVYFAGLGAALPALASPVDAVSPATVAPLLAGFAAVSLLAAARLALRRHSDRRAQ